MAIAQEQWGWLSEQRGTIAASCLVAGFLTLFAPVFITFAGGIWLRPENAHAPFVLAIIAGVVFTRLRAGALRPGGAIETGLGVLVLITGLVAFTIGRAGEVIVLLSASFAITASGVTLAMGGLAGLRWLAFPLFLTSYLVVWPGWALDMATGPLKIAISGLVSNALFALGLPVAHSGAVIAAGPYELLVADACAGINSLIALTAVGVVYLYIAKRKSRLVNFVVIAALVPLAIIANIIRVAVLTLVTLWFGYDAGQGFLHETAGLFLFAGALGGVFVVDAVATALWERRS